MEIKLIIVIFVFMAVLGLGASDFSVQFDEPDRAQVYSEGVFIVNLSNKVFKNVHINIVCAADASVYEKIQFKFTGLSHVQSKFDLTEDTSTGLSLFLKFAPEPDFTGRYEFTAVRFDGSTKVISWYIYFYPDDGRLLLNCEQLGSKSLCKSFYRLKVPFKIPCKPLHPSVKLTSNLETISYDPESGFGIKLNRDHGSFECSAKFDSHSDKQTFELTGISSAIRVDILPPDYLRQDLILIRNDALALVTKGQSLTMTCSAKIGCNDIYYHLNPIIDSNDNYRVEESKDRSACANNFYSLYEYNKTIHFESVTKNETSVSCEVTFEQSELKYSSHRIFLVFSDKQFLRIIPDQPPVVDYLTIGVLNYFFQSSEQYQIKYYRDNKLIVDKDYISYCIHVTLFNYACYFHYQADLIPGKHEVFVSLKENPDLSINQTIYVTIPKKPEILLYRPSKFCSSNWTCEEDKTAIIQCDAQAHDIDDMDIKFVECSDINKCYSLLNNHMFEKELERNFTHMPLRLKRQAEDEPIILVDQDSSVKVQNSPNKFDRVEKAEDRNAWYLKKKLLVKNFHIVYCMALNEKGFTLGKKLIIPSDLNNGLAYDTRVIYERNYDNEIVKGDTFSIQFRFNNILYSLNDYKLRPIENNECLMTVQEPKSSRFSHILQLSFDNVSMSCTNNYTLQVNVDKHPYFYPSQDSSPINPILSYKLNVYEPIDLYFLNLSIHLNQTNDTEQIVAYGDLQIKPDKTLILDCEYYGRPKGKIRWLKDNKTVDLSDEKFNLNEGKLEIFRSHPVDSGTYECHVTNRHGHLKRSFKIHVETATITLKVKEMSKRIIGLIVVVSLCALVLLVLLIFALVKIIKQKRENKKLKRKHQDLFDFLLNGNLSVIEDDILDKKVLGQIKFDDKKFEIEKSNFIILDKVLGEGNFGKVCLAIVSDEPIAAELAQDDAADLSKTERIKKRLSIRRNNQSNYSIASDPEVSKPLIDETKLPKNSRRVAVKICKVKKDATKFGATSRNSKLNSSNLDSLLQELKIMGYLGFHLNVIQLIGCYTKELKSQGNAYVFVEYCSEGDLRNWLRNNSSKYVKNSNDPKNSLFHEKYKSRTSKSHNDTVKQTIEKFNDSDLVFFAYQIARGMKYLADKKFLHRDLAARNILLNENYVCKISDFGLADESKLSSQAYFGKAKGQVPAKWAPPEAFGGSYEATSDVWSFGVVLWEIFSLSETDPYPGIPIREFMDHMDRIKRGEVMPDLPVNGSNELHQVINKCWTVDFNERPTFNLIVPQLEQLLTNFHKNRYESLNENFRQAASTIVEDRILKHDSANRDSKTSVKKANQTNFVSDQKSDNGYLQPIEENSDGYLKPSNGPTGNNLGSYLEPLKNQFGYLEANKNGVNDTYSGKNYTARYYPDTYIGPTPQPSYINSHIPSRYINDEIVNELKEKNLVQTESGDDDGYLMPRQGSTVSSSSTAPLILKKLKSAGSRPARASSKPSAYYMPPKNFANSRLTRANDFNETDV